MGFLNVGERYGGEVYSAESSASNFHACTGWTVDSILDVATQDISGVTWRDLKQPIKVYSNDNTFVIEFGGEGFSNYYTLRTSIRSMSSNNLISARHDGMGRRLAARQAITGMVLGLRQMELYAGDLTGAHFWAKAGVDYFYREELAPYFTHRAQLLKPQLPDERFAQLAHWSKLQRHDYAYKIAWMTNPVIVDADLYDRLGDPATMFENYADKPQSMYAGRGFNANRMTIGQLMYAGLEYAAHIKFNDHRRMERFENYTGTQIRKIVGSISRPNI